MTLDVERGNYPITVDLEHGRIESAICPKTVPGSLIGVQYPGQETYSPTWGDYRGMPLKKYFCQPSRDG